MAKKIPSNLKGTSGKIKDRVFVQSAAYGEHSRDAPKEEKNGTNNKSTSFTTHAQAARFINSFASEIKNLLKTYENRIDAAKLYKSFQTRFHIDPFDNKYVMLSKLKDMDVSGDYLFNTLNYSDIACAQEKKKISVNIKVNIHPFQNKRNANCYFYEAIVLFWKDKGNAIHSGIGTEWVKTGEKPPEFDMSFAKPPGARTWMLLVRLCLGVNNKRLDMSGTNAMKVIDVGTYNNEDVELLEERNKNIEETEKMRMTPDAERVIVRVKRKSRRLD